jgi:hypothetical protein
MYTARSKIKEDKKRSHRSDQTLATSALYTTTKDKTRTRKEIFLKQRQQEENDAQALLSP